MSLASGTQLGRYEILSPLGAGGMGEVYLAEDTRLGRKVALKVLPAEVTEDERRLRRFEQEARAASALNHPNILTVFEIGQSDDRHFIAMEFIEGVTLRHYLAATRMKLGEALEIGIQVAGALTAAHAAGIVHRDIKPENLMVRPDGYVKVLDFGLAKLTERPLPTIDAEASTLVKVETDAGTVMGTASYMSPEQARGQEVDARSDIFSLAVVVYEMVAGRRPFEGGTASDVLAAILRSEPLPLVRHSPTVPAELQRIVSKALAKDREERYQTVKDLLIDLKRLKQRAEVEAELERRQLPASSGQTTPETPKPPPSIAVLPFVNMSPDPENEYFCDGLAEELINALTKIQELRVAARTSAFSFKSREVDVREIGQKLSVSIVLEGSVRKVGHRLRITAQLVNVVDGYQLWSERYDRELEDVFAIQDEITLAIVRALKVKLLGGEKAAVMKRYTDNIEAYQLYLKGRYFWNQRTEEGLRKGIDWFQQAITLDPNYAVAYTGLADCYAFLGDVGILAVPPREAFSNALAAATKALQIDDTLAEAHTSMAHLRMHHFEWLEAEREFKRAIELNPNYATTYHWYAFYFAAHQRYGEALATIARAQELDPISPAINIDVGVLHYYAGQYDQAIAQYRKTLELYPGFARAYVTLGSAYGQKGMHDEATAMVQKAIALSGDTAKLMALGRLYAAAGRTDDALKIIDELREMSKQRYISAYALGLIYAALDEIDRAFDYLEAAYAERAGDLIFLKADPWLSPLRSDPRFQDLLRRVGLPPKSLTIPA